MKVYESKTLISAMENRSYEYKSLREKLINLQNAFQGMADLGDDFQGKGADNIKAFYKEHARNIDEWLAMIDMQTAFFDSISVSLEEADLAGNTFVDVSFLENELEIAYQKSNAIVAEQKQALKVILNDIKDIVPLEVFSTADFKQHISDSKVEKDNTIDKINEVDSKLRKEYKKSELNQDYIEARSKALIDATGKGKNAQPINFNATAYYDTKVFKYRDEIHKKTQEYLTIKKDEAEKIAAEKERQRIEVLKKKLETTIDNAEYIKIADEIGYDNLTTDQKVIYNLAKFNKTGDDILNGIGTGLKDVVVDTATGIWDTVTNPMETLEGIGNVIIHPVDTFNIVKQGIEESFERDVINGDAESRARWFSYAVGMVGTSVVGTKGVDKVGKAAKAGKLGQVTTKATKVPKKVASKAIMISKEALEKSVASFKKSTQRVVSKIKGIQIHNPFAPQVEFAGIGKVPYNVLNGEKIKEKFIQFIKSLNPRTRLPRNYGRWEGVPGNGKWYSDRPEVIAITKGAPVVFKDGRPDFTPWKVGEDLKFKSGELKGTNADFDKVYERIMIEKNLKSLNQAKIWLRKEKLTPHHLDRTTIQLIPTDLHKNVPHIGSASDLRGGY
ncbi:putative ribonuclease YokI [Bacillus sonorensis]|uniref:T7SS effector LXG polymorphic toxin n=1 Tax=Bacillus sonorensis TaxID=119858 RepID=UPI001B0F730A|nr:T7SS effector LXG polymorphic toxin [Bacillus sonorensis]GIN66295.1 putative ribonuclease YokI [Bacillus sonorensis]